MALHPELNGLLAHEGSTPVIFLVDRGARREVPDPATRKGLFGDASAPAENLFADIDLGPPIPTTSLLAKIEGTAAIFLVEGSPINIKRHITSGSVKSRYHFNGNVHSLPRAALDSIPTGDPIV